MPTTLLRQGEFVNADQNKTRDELLRELCELRERVPHLEALASEHERARTLQ